MNSFQLYQSFNLFQQLNDMNIPYNLLKVTYHPDYEPQHSYEGNLNFDYSQVIKYMYGLKELPNEADDLYSTFVMPVFAMNEEQYNDYVNQSEYHSTEAFWHGAYNFGLGPKLGLSTIPWQQYAPDRIPLSIMDYQGGEGLAGNLGMYYSLTRMNDLAKLKKHAYEQEMRFRESVDDAGFRLERYAGTKGSSTNLFEKFIGKDYKVITNKAGDKILMSNDGLRKIRFDFKNPHSDVPHVHFEKLVNGKWKDFFNDIHRFYPKQ